MIHVLYIEMPGRVPQIAGIFGDEMQACWTMIAVCQVLNVRAAWVTGQHEPPPPMSLRLRAIGALECTVTDDGPVTDRACEYIARTIESGEQP